MASGSSLYISFMNSGNDACLELDAGLAADYYITDPERKAAIVRAPCAVIVTQFLDRANAASAMARFGKRPLPKRRPSGLASLFRRDRPQPVVEQTAGIEEMEKGFRECLDLVAAGSFKLEYEIERSLMFVASQIEPEANAGLTIIKMRGVCLIAAVLANAQSMQEVRRWLSRATGTQESCGQVLVYRFDRDMTAVAGIKKTILSATAGADEIFRRRPNLSS